VTPKPAYKDLQLSADYLALCLFYFRQRTGHYSICPNVNLHGAESDLLSIKDSCTYDHEIKITRADFRTEMKKARNDLGVPEDKWCKHRSAEWFYRTLTLGEKLNATEFFDWRPQTRIEEANAHLYIARVEPLRWCPNYFYFVAPVGVIPEAEVPPYAGLIEINLEEAFHPRCTNIFKVVKRAPRLHKNLIADAKTEWLSTRLMWRLWKAKHDLHNEKSKNANS
jgi:hypothetical protein